MQRLRISAISFLNTAPLMWDFEHGDAGKNFDISYTLPSQCAAALAAGTADIGIIPAAAYATIPGLAILPGVAIASQRPVRSILLVSKVPLHEIRSVALDTSSMTSVALTKVLFAKWWNVRPTFASMPPFLDTMLKTHDAAMLIGDPALKVDRSRYLSWDLAEEWIQLTGKPFVFAFWALRKPGAEQAQSSISKVAEIFQKSRDHGLEPENLRRIAREWASAVNLTEDQVRSYLTENIHYYLDSECLAGLRLFYRYAAEAGALPHPPDLSFVETAKELAG